MTKKSDGFFTYWNSAEPFSPEVRSITHAYGDEHLVFDSKESLDIGKGLSDLAKCRGLLPESGPFAPLGKVPSLTMGVEYANSLRSVSMINKLHIAIKEANRAENRRSESIEE